MMENISMEMREEFRSLIQLVSLMDVNQYNCMVMLKTVEYFLDVKDFDTFCTNEFLTKEVYKRYFKRVIMDYHPEWNKMIKKRIKKDKL